jgi:hypothetical protein
MELQKIYILKIYIVTGRLNAEVGEVGERREIGQYQ